MRILGFIFIVSAASLAHAAKPDPAVYPNPNIYRDPAIARTPGQGFAKVIREFCPGQGRGQIHFLEVDGQLIRIRKTWPTYLELAPGHHRLSLEFMAPASDIWSSWNGKADVSADIEAGKTYLIRYQRTAVDAFRVAIVPYPQFDGVGLSTQVCDQLPFPDVGVHQ
ncbi:hypothetical protein [Arenimonas sp. GDDSR-1]|uniref:hypothetical protein n=1 Tax=Arenimonas sp. GDDSR-1 TaxID=2950125 RepID=UPI002619C01A|nr:hypothetical protein [Arenimonas sp. GDDSR-1]